MGGELPKQFMLVYEKPVLYYTLKTFLEAFEDIQIILVLPVDYTDMGQEIIDAWFEKEKIIITAGGDTRFQSVKNGLQLVEDDSIVFVHDGVRCLLSADLIKRCYRQAMETGTAIPVVASMDSVRMINEEGNDAVDRKKVMLVQTPQTFHSKILSQAFRIDYKEKFTDEASVVEAFGLKVTLVEGEEGNIKITRPMDLWIAEKILEQRRNQEKR
jgi:2-C-methyl-D-erythritol 4-phosphate cytidylyltransferase